VSPLDRFQALTFCLEAAVRENRITELPSLLEARAKMIEEMLASGEPVDGQRLASLREVEQRLMRDLQARRNATLERLNTLRMGKRARKTYSRAA